ncbi:hypothetical protein SAMN06296378_2012 [Salinibacterium xinjiangense]|uniref:Secreted protein n=1 Tax=Salinibacterium xinjiangense TaxID=386302 RepID=A0A2C8ZVA1_9MICO|nr:hypothetical protein SAMN06296378_2012 [Salinibacterium xinjiangense]
MLTLPLFCIVASASAAGAMSPCTVTSAIWILQREWLVARLNDRPKMTGSPKSSAVIRTRRQQYVPLNLLRIRHPTVKSGMARLPTTYDRSLASATRGPTDIVWK